MVVERIVTAFPAFAVISLLLCIVYGLLTFTVTRRKYLQIPGPVPWPIIGNFLDFTPYLTGPLTMNDCMLKWSFQYGSIFKFWVGNKPWIIVSDPEYVQEILHGKNFPKDPTYYSPIGTLYGQRFAGGGSAIQTNPEKHEQQRRINSFVYHKKYLSKHSQACVSVAGRWITSLETMTDWFAMCKELDILSTSTICKIAFNMDTALTYKGDNIYRMVAICFDGIKDTLFNPLGATLYFKKVERVRNAAKALREVGETFIRATYEKIRAGEPFPEAMFSYVLQELHEAGGAFTLEEIIDEFIIQLVAGTETTSNTMKFTLMEVTKHPYVYKRLQDEIDRVMSVTTPETYYEDLNKMVYLEQVLQEILRLYPVALATTRTNPKDTYLGKNLIPARSTLMVCFHVLQRNPNNFPRPNEFDPDRWGPGKPAPMPFTYLPFSSGPRSCPGRFLAKTEVKIMLSNLLYHYDLEVHPDQNYDLRTTLSVSPKHKIYMKATSRQKSRSLFPEDIRVT